MADSKISELTELTAVQTGDLLAIVDDPSGTPVTKKITVDTLSTLFNTNSMARQAIINGNFDVWQRGVTFTTPNDDTYGPDRWNFLVDGNGAWTFSRSLVDSDTCPNSTYELKAVNVTANKQCGIVQILESINSMKLSNKYLTISFRARTTTGKVISNLRTTLLSWEGTADTVTSDVISSWAGGGTVPTWATNWAQFDATSPTLMALTTDSQKFSFTVGLGPQGFNNLALVVWVDDTTITSGDEFYITEVQLCAGDVALPFMPKSFEEELRACQRYYEKSFPYNIAPADNATVLGSIVNVNAVTGNYNFCGFVKYSVQKRIAVSPTLYNPAATDANKIRSSAGTNHPASITSVSDSSFGVYINNSDTSATNIINTNWTADAEL